MFRLAQLAQTARAASLLLALALQVAPLCRAVLPAAQGSTGWALVMKWACGAVALFGFHAIAGATGPRITSGAVTNATRGQSFTYRITTDPAPGTPPDYLDGYHYRFVANPLPPGITINTNTGVISGVPTVSGVYSPITLLATNEIYDGITANLTINVNNPPGSPVITSDIQSTEGIVGGSASFTVTVTGNTPLTYRWRKDGGVLAGNNSPTLTLNNLVLTNAGSYDVIVSNSLAWVTSQVATLTVSMPPSFTQQPVSQTVAVGATAMFSFNSTGVPPPSVQWRKGGVNIPGATSNPLSLPNVQQTDAGSYSAVLANFAGSATSSVVTLTVQGPPQITVPPTNLTVLAGVTTNFSVTALSSPAPGYQWRKDGTNLPNATNATLGLTNVQFASAGSYVVVVTNIYGAVTSSPPAVLTIMTVPVITSGPVNQSVAVGGTANFAVVATGTPAPTYQWRRNGVNVGGATGDTLTINNVQNGNAGNYTVVVANPAGSVTSAPPAVLTVLTPPSINPQPVSQTAALGAEIFFDAFTQGSAPLVHQWRFRPLGQTNFIDLPGENFTTLYFEAIVATNAGDYYLFVTNSVGSASSTVVSLTVQGPPTITAAPASQTVTVGGTAVFTVAAVASPAPTYQWRKGGANISGATSATLTLNNVQSTNAGSYDVVVANANGSVTSAPPAVLTVNASTPPVIVIAPTNQVVMAGGTASFSITATGAPPPGIQWRKSGVALPNETNTTLLLTSLTNRAAGGGFDVVVTNSAGTVTTNFTLRVTVAQRIWQASRLPDGRVRVLFGDEDGGSMALAAPANFVVETETGLDTTNWQVLPRPLTLTNGWFLLEDSEATNNLLRFYRVIER
ncbi:MAG: immunoglobulin domain-containing protein [Verrucomicrobia bacterium]|nr:immunoglobulin domain-containing protein [Verrucomicrobiota bacterium]